MPTKKSAAYSLTFRPNDAFPTANGFFVRASVESIESTLYPDMKPRRVVVAHAWEPDGYEVVFTGPGRPLVELVGQEIDIPGHAILAYSGELGPWAPARIRDPQRQS